MTDYTAYNDVKVSANNGKVRWVDYGEIRELDPDDALELSKMLASAAVEAGAQE